MAFPVVSYFSNLCSTLICNLRVFVESEFVISLPPQENDIASI